MNDPLLLTERLGELAKLASQANTGFEKAAVYAAAAAIRAEFDLASDDFDGYALEKAASACQHICSAVGYDVTNGHEISQHVSWAYGQISTLKNILEKIYPLK